MLNRFHRLEGDGIEARLEQPLVGGGDFLRAASDAAIGFIVYCIGRVYGGCGCGIALGYGLGDCLAVSIGGSREVYFVLQGFGFAAGVACFLAAGDDTDESGAEAGRRIR